MKKNVKREGFTLVELLIVIVVIGVLSAMMMLSSTEAVSSAKAADIISDLRNLKTAALAYYADHLDAVEAKNNNKYSWAGLGDNEVKKEVLKYMGNNTDDPKYTFGGKADTSWFVWCNVTDTTVFSKLKSRASSTGLYLMNGSDTTKSADLSAATVTSGHVGMFIR